MGYSLEKEEFDQLQSKYPSLFSRITVFFESGTYKGETTRLASTLFKKVITTELKDTLYEEAITHPNKGHNVDYLLEDSVDALFRLISSFNEPVFFFLDGHQSGPDSTHGKYGNVPLVSELNIISTFQHDCIICIDDVRLWNKFWDWDGITVHKILQILKPKVTNTVKFEHFEHNDRYYFVFEGIHTLDS
jgi:hypothetical protein